MNVKQLKAYLESKRGVLSCVNYDSLVKAVDFQALEKIEVKADGDFGLFCWGEPALSIEQNTATINIRGLLMPNVGWDAVGFGLTGYDVIEHYIHYANSLPQITQIVLDIDSGGGYADGVQHCADVIMNSTKPIRTVVSGGMYSAAYWLGCSTGNITASKYAGVGSIGAYAEHFDRSKQLEQQGIVARLFSSGKWKGAFSSNRPLTEEEQVRLQQAIDDLANEFFAHVARKRGLSEKVVAGFEGDAFTAERAFELGLIDRIEDVNQTEFGGEEKMKENGQTEQAKALTADEIEQIRAQAREEAKAEMQAKMEREQGINALKASADVKKVLASDAFASVPLEAMSELINVMPKGLSQVMDESGGAGVEADPQGFAPKTKEQKQLDKQAKSQAMLAKLNKKGL